MNKRTSMQRGRAFHISSPCSLESFAVIFSWQQWSLRLWKEEQKADRVSHSPEPLLTRGYITHSPLHPQAARRVNASTYACGLCARASCVRAIRQTRRRKDRGEGEEGRRLSRCGEWRKGGGITVVSLVLWRWRGDRGETKSCGLLADGKKRDGT